MNRPLVALALLAIGALSQACSAEGATEAESDSASVTVSAAEAALSDRYDALFAESQRCAADACSAVAREMGQVRAEMARYAPTSREAILAKFIDNEPIGPVQYEATGETRIGAKAYYRPAVQFTLQSSLDAVGTATARDLDDELAVNMNNVERAYASVTSETKREELARLYARQRVLRETFAAKRQAL